MKYHYLLPLLGLFLVRELFTFFPVRLLVTIERVLDGDTLQLQGGKRVRLRGIDAPEKEQLARDGSSAGGLATQCLRQLVAQGEWRLENLGRDIYGRTLGELWREGERLSVLSVRAGCSTVYPFEREPLLWHEREVAMRERRGLWGHGGFERPYVWRKRNKKARMRGPKDLGGKVN